MTHRDLTVLQNSCLRIILGAYKVILIAILHYKLNILYIKDLLETKQLKYKLKKQGIRENSYLKEILRKIEKKLNFIIVEKENEKKDK